MSCHTSLSSFENLKSFSFEKLIEEGIDSRFLLILGTIRRSDNQDLETAIIRVEKTALNISSVSRLLGKDGIIQRAEWDGIDDSQSTGVFSGWFGDERQQDLKVNIICPATEVHVRKYSKQDFVMIRETPEIYEKKSRVAQKDKVLFTSGQFLIVPDIKWDMHTVSSLYLLAIVRDPSILSLRSLRKRHLGLLKSIRQEALKVAAEKWGVRSLRMLIHYQPTYYHFHVHIVNANYQGGGWGMLVGHAHLLDTVISLLEMDSVEGPGVYEKITLTYAIGVQHGLYQLLKDTGVGLELDVD
ncbi:hypothetical protein CVT24_008797 [Panaeolus cyanescens]|uniref:HIT domain-containing protein n=1 Tax=Panaeolus cyanescens TaxID=181874 RepID=A0A409VB54_9AGAR|nr:hypothetical protein CVT24_008797 [Panaeolus cyanescens]